MLRFTRLSSTIANTLALRSQLLALRPPAPLINNSFIWVKTQTLSTMGRMGFATLRESSEDTDENQMIEDSSDNWKVDYSAAINMYPFHHIPVGLVRNPDKFSMEETMKQELIAFKALSLQGEDLDKAIHLLLSPQQIVAIENEPHKHQGLRVFQHFFQDRLLAFITQINKAEGSYEERLKGMNVLSILNGVYLENRDLPFLEERSVVKQDPSGVLAAYYVRYAINNHLDYVHILPLLSQKMEKLDAEVKLKIARSIISAPYFSKNYPKKLVEMALGVYRDQLKTLHNYEILFSMRLAYDYQCETAKEYARAIVKHIISKHVEEGDIDFHVPMILKSIKYVSKQQLSCDQLINFISNNIQRFRIIFEKKNISKGLFFSLMFSSIHHKNASDQVLGYLKDYFLNEIDSIVKAKEVEDGEILRLSKLLIRYMARLTPGEKEHIKNHYLNYIIPQFGHHNEVLLYSLLVVLRDRMLRPEKPDDILNFEKNIEMIKKGITHYLRESSEVVNGKRVIVRNINSAIELYYQNQRHELNISKEELPSLLEYNFSQKDTVIPEVLGYFFTYLSHAQERVEDIKRVMEELTPHLEIYLRKKKMGLNTLYSILHVCDKAGYEHQFLFRHIQNNFAYRLINDPTLNIPDKDIRFLHNKLIKKGYGSANFRKFIQSVIENPKNWEKSRYEYTEKEKVFLSKINNRQRKNRQ